MVEPTAPMCEQCKVPLIEIDTFGERLRGCVGCNQWQVVLSGEWAEATRGRYRRTPRLRFRRWRHA
jgi:hypothetical protein